jgi:hypothetical protein
MARNLVNGRTRLVVAQSKHRCDIAPYTDYNLSVNTDSEAEQRMSQGHPGSEREGHRATMASIPGTQAATQGFKFEDHSKVVLERFEVLWPNDRASELVYISRQRDNAIPEKSISEGV